MILLETHIYIVHTTYTQSEEHFSRTTKTHFTATRSETSKSVMAYRNLSHHSH